MGKGRSLECPECRGKLVWNVEQHVCTSCPWTEFTAKPPTHRSLPAARPPDEPSKKEEKGRS
jgi:hypothetical protein